MNMFVMLKLNTLHSGININHNEPHAVDCKCKYLTRTFFTKKYESLALDEKALY